ncbi:RICIN domain-containing protein [Streptomyces mirabilis]|uniref:RICIN domain-containing protein n=1 Tax=Streptomyces mirabilis TaxID=68239 RepID=UPI0036D8EC22
MTGSLTISGAFRLGNRRSGKVLDIKDGSTADGATAIVWAWSGGINQQWRFQPNHDGSFRLVSVKSGKVLESPGGSTTKGQVLDQWTDNSATHQWWKVVPTSGGYCRLVNVKRIHRAFARARLKDGAGVYSNIKKILGNDMVFKSLMTSHNPQPDQLSKGTIKGVRGRNRIRVESLTWDLDGPPFRFRSATSLVHGSR